MTNHIAVTLLILLFLILNIFSIAKMVRCKSDILKMSTKYLFFGVLIFPISIWRNYALVFGQWKIVAIPLIIIFVLFLQNTGFLLHNRPGDLSPFEALLIKSAVPVLVLMIPVTEVLLKLFRPYENKSERGPH